MKLWMVTVPALALFTGTAVAQLSQSAGPQFPVMTPSSITTSRGPALVTGDTGTMRTIMIPGSPVGGLLLNNGNGTSTLMVPGGPSEVISTPR